LDARDRPSTWRGPADTFSTAVFIADDGPVGVRP
jgi:hypothetical protein